MKFFVCFALIAAVAVAVAAASPTGSLTAGINQEVEGAAADAQQAQSAAAASAQAIADLTRLRKSASYGGGSSYGASIPAPPCPKNYLFSCQPNLAPVPCSAPAPSYGSQGAYSAPLPSFAAPIRGNYGVPQTYNGGAAYMPQGLGYNGYYQY